MHAAILQKYRFIGEGLAIDPIVFPEGRDHWGNDARQIGYICRSMPPRSMDVQATMDTTLCQQYRNVFRS